VDITDLLPNNLVAPQLDGFIIDLPDYGTCQPVYPPKEGWLVIAAHILKILIFLNIRKTQAAK